LERARGGANEGLWLRAGFQSAGRGRLGRPWSSLPGNLLTSTIIRLRQTDPAAATLAFAVAVAAHISISKLAPWPAFQIKWPNDILTATGEKLCGILLERCADAVVIGIGVNLAHYPLDTGRAVTSIAALGYPVPSAQDFAKTLAADFADVVNRWRQHGAESILVEWQERAHPKGTSLSVHLPNGKFLNGNYIGLAADGALQLRLADGSIHVVHAADVFLE
jgi:BirA family transcriptional regulator, biotin operon repressor / biotin---[acetyl-CoA-carboxylase] ligase